MNTHLAHAKQRTALALVMALTATLLSAATSTTAADADETNPLTITFVNVRQGDAIVVAAPCGDIGLIDTPRYRDAEVLAALDAAGGRDRLTVATPSHYDSDHLGAFTEVLSAAIAAGATPTVYDRGGSRTVKDTATYRRYYDFVTTNDIRHALTPGEQFTLCEGEQQVTFTTIAVNGITASGVDTGADEENDLGVCLLVEHDPTGTPGGLDNDGFDFFACGDVNGTGTGSRTDIESAIAPLLPRVELVKVGHHGSPYATDPDSPALVPALDNNDPDGDGDDDWVAVVSAGRNAYGHPAPAVEQRLTAAGADLYVTGNGDGTVRDGTVTVTVNSNGTFDVAAATGRTNQHIWSTTDTTPETNTEPTDGTQPDYMPVRGDACPDGQYRTGQFNDTNGVHGPNIDCAYWWNVVTDDFAHDSDFHPSDNANRGTFAVLIDRYAAAVGQPLPATDRDYYSDDNDYPGEDAINRAVAAGMIDGYPNGTFRPYSPVTRGQMAALMARSYDHLGLVRPSPIVDQFSDDDGTTFEADINLMATLGVALGHDSDHYDPQGLLSRAQAATYTVRLLDYAVGNGTATPTPDTEPDPTTPPEPSDDPTTQPDPEPSDEPVPTNESVWHGHITFGRFEHAGVEHFDLTTSGLSANDEVSLNGWTVTVGSTGDVLTIRDPYHLANGNVLRIFPNSDGTSDWDHWFANVSHDWIADNNETLTLRDANGAPVDTVNW